MIIELALAAFIASYTVEEKEDEDRVYWDTEGDDGYSEV